MPPIAFAQHRWNSRGHYAGPAPDPFSRPPVYQPGAHLHSLHPPPLGGGVRGRRLPMSAKSGVG
eukprot:5422763-Alexandrium_andersonii.AAC.1